MGHLFEPTASLGHMCNAFRSNPSTHHTDMRVKLLVEYCSADDIGCRVVELSQEQRDAIERASHRGSGHHDGA